MDIWNVNDPRNLDKAFKGGGKGSSGPSAAEIEAQKQQEAELADLQAKEDARTKAMERKRRGRASLLSGTETGEMKTKLGE